MFINIYLTNKSHYVFPLCYWVDTDKLTLRYLTFRLDEIYFSWFFNQSNILLRLWQLSIIKIILIFYCNCVRFRWFDLSSRNHLSFTFAST